MHALVKLAVTAAIFAIGVFILEASGSALHAEVLHDVPPELSAKGVTLGWMLKRDAVIAAIAGAALFLVALLRSSRRSFKRSSVVVLAGVGFALVLEALNWLLPGALFDPSNVWEGIAAWALFVFGVCLAFNAASYRIQPGA